VGVGGAQKTLLSLPQLPLLACLASSCSAPPPLDCRAPCVSFHSLFLGTSLTYVPSTLSFLGLLRSF
jgi:hypothetical protein